MRRRPMSADADILEPGRRVASCAIRLWCGVAVVAYAAVLGTYDVISWGRPRRGQPGGDDHNDGDDT